MSIPISNSMQDTDRRSSNDRKHYLGVLGLDEAEEAIFKEKILALAEVYLDMHKPVSQQIEDWELYIQQAYVLVPAMVPPKERCDDSVRFFLGSLHLELSHLTPFLEATGVKSGTKLRAMGTWRFERIRHFIDSMRKEHPEVTQFAANVITLEIASLGAPCRPMPMDTF
ncbi:hypothetical protein GLOTRDRAFT_133171 [Gloeophyllum trabeum ATCC 11539]|uniref:Uncharacterized protein n=1 Tax=Gloeophyllum trabeum (strain ATCC 11539 / FP-39264 / Madison 617) TaxID=670483 RepID=S7RAL5_GLOTA|nr:uncharacterized protein GLOTRDRAFT_133171 [Gloeophyllum trabeum ATCC 11539]EPQ51300.1 hypothetical protein GLOTRDRAFT_133171 [Gloeophyllum trabeum ATCC 11539]